MKKIIYFVILCLVAESAVVAANLKVLRPKPDIANPSAATPSEISNGSEIVNPDEKDPLNYLGLNVLGLSEPEPFFATKHGIDKAHQWKSAKRHRPLNNSGNAGSLGRRAAAAAAAAAKRGHEDATGDTMNQAHGIEETADPSAEHTDKRTPDVIWLSQDHDEHVQTCDTMWPYFLDYLRNAARGVPTGNLSQWAEAPERNTEIKLPNTEFPLPSCSGLWISQISSASKSDVADNICKQNDNTMALVKRTNCNWCHSLLGRVTSFYDQAVGPDGEELAVWVRSDPESPDNATAKRRDLLSLDKHDDCARVWNTLKKAGTKILEKEQSDTLGPRGVGKGKGDWNRGKGSKGKGKGGKGKGKGKNGKGIKGGKGYDRDRGGKGYGDRDGKGKGKGKGWPRESSYSILTPAGGVIETKVMDGSLYVKFADHIAQMDQRRHTFAPPPPPPSSLHDDVFQATPEATPKRHHTFAPPPPPPSSLHDDVFQATPEATPKRHHTFAPPPPSQHRPSWDTAPPPSSISQHGDTITLFGHDMMTVGHDPER
jgi:hypothetical protein